MAKYRNCSATLAINGDASPNCARNSNLPWDWFIIFVMLGSLGLMSWGRFNQLLTPVILVFFTTSLFFIYLFRINKWDISGPIFQFTTSQEFGRWQEIYGCEKYFQTSETEPSEVDKNQNITANLVDCLVCGKQVPVKSDTCIQCGAPYLV